VRRALLPALAVLPFALALLAPGVTIPGERGALRLAEGFVPGRWDARFVVARGPAALRLPARPLRVALDLRGPAALRVETSEGAFSRALPAEAQRVELGLPRGGAVALAADAPLRLEALRVERLGPPPLAPLALLAALLAGALYASRRLASRRRGTGALLIALASGLAAAGVCRGEGLSWIVLRAWADAFGPVLALAALVALFFCVRLAPGGGRAPAPVDWRLPAGAALLVLASSLAQVLLRPQPLLEGDMGDPAEYWKIAGFFRDALPGAIAGPAAFADALQALRPYGGLALLGLVYGLARALYDTPQTVYVLHALAVAGAVFFLVRAAARLFGRRAAWLTGALALLTPSLALSCGLLQPEPLVLLAWCWAFDRLAASDAPRDLALAGLAFGLGLALHPQGIWFLLLALALALGLLAPLLARRVGARASAAVALGLLPVVALVAAGERYAAPASAALDERHGFWAYTAPVPLGFWLFLESDGWQGPRRVVDGRFAREYLHAAERGEVEGPAARLAFVLRFVSSHAAESARAVLVNLRRLFAFPDNPGRVDWLLPYTWQVALYRAAVVLFLVAAPLLLASGRAGVALLPYVLLAATYPLYHVFNKYAVPALPFVLLGAAAVLDALPRARARRPLLAALACAAAGAALDPARLALYGLPATPARALALLLELGGLAAAALFSLRLLPGAPRVAVRGGPLVALTAALLVVPAGVAAWHDTEWRAVGLGLERPLRHEILMGQMARLDLPAERHLLFDLLLPGGDPSRLSFRFDGGFEVPGTALRPTMPRFGLASLRFHRDPRAFRQWWALAFDSRMAPGGGRLGVEVRGGAGDVLFGRLLARPGVDDGPSLGQWPALSVYRLMHDGEYRLTTEQPLAGFGRVSASLDGPLPAVLSVRLVEVAAPSPTARWSTAPGPDGPWQTAVKLHLGGVSRLAVTLPGDEILLDLDGREHAGRTSAARYEQTGPDAGWLRVRSDAGTAGPRTLSLRCLPSLAGGPRFVELQAEAAPAAEGPVLLPLARIEESGAAPSWRPLRVY
jgi:hypothetical protein